MRNFLQNFVMVLLKFVPQVLRAVEDPAGAHQAVDGAQYLLDINFSALAIVFIDRREEGLDKGVDHSSNFLGVHRNNFGGKRSILFFARLCVFEGNTCTAVPTAALLCVRDVE